MNARQKKRKATGRRIAELEGAILNAVTAPLAESLEQRIQREPGSRSASFAPASLDEEARTVDLVWSTGAPVLRRDWDGDFFEELSMNPRHVRMGRLASGATPLLVNHDTSTINSVVGVVESARIEKGQGIATVRFADDPDSERVFRKVASGILRNISVGYRIHRLEKVEGGDGTTPVFRATDWEPHELSIVTVPADPTAIIRSASSNPGATHMDTDLSNTDTAIAAERERAAEITALTSRHGLEAWGARMVSDGTTVEDARALVLDELAKRSNEVRTIPPMNQSFYMDDGGENGVRVGELRAMSLALASRMGVNAERSESNPRVLDAARQYKGLSLEAAARMMLERAGDRSASRLSRAALFERAMGGGRRGIGGMHTTSDFPALLQATGDRMLLDGFNAHQSGLKSIARKEHANDFRERSFIRVGELKDFDRVNEHGEFKSTTLTTSEAGLRVETFGTMVALSRQSLVNDDLGALDMFRKLGQRAAEFEVRQIVSLITSAANLEDGAPFFHASRGNLGTGGPISIQSLGEALKLMRLQKGLDGSTPLNLTPQFLVVPAALETVALQYTAQLNAQQAQHVNPYASRLEVIVDPRLDADSSTAWYMFAHPGMSPAIVYAYLDGAEGPQIFAQEGWRVDGVEWKCRLDFGAAVIAPEAAFKNEGA